ncbi:MAG: hypothetical protein ACRDY7_11230 [Acidimicrobiia bacterium]
MSSPIGEQPPRTGPATPVPERVAVRNPRSRVVWQEPGQRALTELREQTGVGDHLLRSLMRAQLALAVRVFAVFGCLLLGLPVLFVATPGIESARVAGIPVPWVILGALVYPLLVLLAWLYVRVAERNEKEFVEIIERT